MTTKPKILFSFVEAGLGHIAPMQAIFDTFCKKYGDKCQITGYFVFKDSKEKSVNKMGKSLLNASKLNSKYYLINRIEKLSYSFSSKFIHKILDFNFKKGEKDFIGELEEMQPDMVVSTYYLPTHITAKANERKKVNALTVTYSADPYIYPAWDRNCDLFLVTNDNAFNMAINKGFDKNKVKKVPFVFREKIVNCNLTKTVAKEKLNINKDKLHVVLSNGAYGSKNSVKLVKKILKSDLDITLTVICGKNQRIFNLMQRLKRKIKSSVNLVVLGFVENMQDYLASGDVCLGKAGSNSIMESVFFNTSMIVFTEGNPLEEETAKWAESNGLIIREHNFKKIVEIIRRKDKDRDFFVIDKKARQEFLNKDGAEKSADLIFELLKTRFNIE